MKTRMRHRPLCLEALEDRLAPAATFTWNDSGTDWATAARWNCDDPNLMNAYPGSGGRTDDIVKIPAKQFGGTNEVILDTSVTIGRFEITNYNKAVKVNAGKTLSLNQRFTLSGALAELKIDGTIQTLTDDVAGCTWEGGKITGSGTLRIDKGNDLYVSGGASELSANLELGMSAGTATSYCRLYGMDGALTLKGSATITVGQKGNLWLNQNNNGVYAANGSILVDANWTGSAIQAEGVVYRSSTSATPGGVYVACGLELYNNSTFTLYNGKIEISGGTTFDGYSLQQHGGTIEFYKGTELDLDAFGALFTKNVKFIKGAGTGAITIQGDVLADGATITFDTSPDIQVVVDGDLTLNACAVTMNVTPGGAADHISVTGSLSIGGRAGSGTLALVFTSMPSSSGGVELFNAGTLVGQFFGVTSNYALTLTQEHDEGGPPWHTLSVLWTV